MKKVFYSPIENTSRAWIYAGLFLRTLITYLGVLGFTALICSSIGFASSDWWGACKLDGASVALLSVPVAVFCAVSSLWRYSFPLTFLGYAGAYFGYVSLVFGSPVDFTVKSALRMYNMALYHLSSLGYSSFGNHIIPDGYDYSAAMTAESDPYRFCGAFLIASIIGFVLYFCVQKKVRVIPLAIFSTIIIAPVLTYNLAKGTAGIGFTVCFICGALGMKIYDRAYGKNREKILEQKLEKKKKKEIRKNIIREKQKTVKERKRIAHEIYMTAIESELGTKKAAAAKKAYLHALKIADHENRKKEKKNKKSLQKHDTALIDKSQKKENARKERFVSYLGGFAGFGTVLVVFLSLWIPMACVKGNFKIIEPINNKAQLVSAYVTAYLQGNDVDLNDLYAYGIDELAPRKLSFEPLKFNERKLFRVESESDNNVYLRSWVGTSFDYQNEEWKSFTTDEVLSYRQKFGKDFSPDTILNNFYKYVYPSSSIIENNRTYKNFLKYGFAEESVNVWRVSGRSRLLFVPSHINTDIKLTSFGTLEDAQYKYSNYCEGVYSSRFYKYGTGFGTVSYVAAYNRKNCGESMENSVTYYELCKKYITDAQNIEKSENRRLSEDETDKIIYNFDKESNDNGIEYMGTSLVERYFYSMTEKEQKECIASFEKELAYRDFVYNNYLAQDESETVKKIAENIKEEALLKSGKNSLNFHETVVSVKDYFQKDFKYTNTPDKEKYDGEKSVLDAFLTDVKEGYCTHFATAAIAILREYGIPCRYAEGIVAKDLKEVSGGTAKYRSYALDSDASSWIEIYVDGMGWVQYEVSPTKLSDDMYSPKSATLKESENGAKVSEKENNLGEKFGEDGNSSVEEIIEKLGKKEQRQKTLKDYIKIASVILLILIFAGVVFLFIRIIYKKAQKKLGERFEIIHTLQKEGSDKTEEFGLLLKKVNDMILETLSLIGDVPEKGELPEAFAKRVFENHGYLSKTDVREVFRIMERSEFGHGATYEEAYLCADYQNDISNAIYKNANIIKKIKLRYIMRKV